MFFLPDNMDKGDIACDGYHKYKEDVKIMAEMGLEAFRLSISWSRLIPSNTSSSGFLTCKSKNLLPLKPYFVPVVGFSDGRGPINRKGLRFYKNLIKELLTHGIEPHVTLYHYDLPQALEDEYGGWINRKIIEDFTAFADVCFREFGEDVKLWTTVNEANIFAIGGYSEGILPPGHCSITKYVNCSTGNSSTEPYIVGHNTLLAHASASNLYRLKYKSKQRGLVGLCIYTYGFSPYTNSKEDEIATQRAKDFYFGWLLKPLVFGDYPDVMKRVVGTRLPVFSEEESKQVRGSSDFIGVIHYTTLYVTKSTPTPSILPSNQDFSTDMGVETICLATKHDSTLQDTARVEYIQSYIGAMLNAIRNGSDTRGYFYWSMIDLYELLAGYRQAQLWTVLREIQ